MDDRTVDGRPWSLVAQAFEPAGGDCQRMGNIDRRRRTAGGWQIAVGQAFRPVREANRQRMGNESTNQTVDRGRRTAVGQAFRPVGGENRQRIGERINEWTADRRRTGFPACQKTAIKQTRSEGKLCAFVSWWFIIFYHEGTKTRRE
jgi:hypothetical protein